MKQTFTFFISLIFCVHFSFAQFPPLMNGISGPSGVCAKPAAATFTAHATGTITSYSWGYTGPFGGGGVFFGSPNSSVTTISFPYAGQNTSYTIHCVAYNNNAPSVGTGSYVVTVHETPNVSFSGSTYFCQGSSTNLSASGTIFQASSTTITYNWSPSTGLNTTTGPNVIASPPASVNYTVLLTLGSCTNTAIVAVHVATCTVGIPEDHTSEINSLQAFPNPGSEFIILKTQKDVLAIILDQIGKEVRSLKLVAGEETRITGLSAGMYYVITPETRKKIVITK